MRITWVGHATVLLELDGTRLLTDPILRKRIAHLRTVQPPPRRGRARADRCRTPVARPPRPPRRPFAPPAREEACRCWRHEGRSGRSAAAGSGGRSIRSQRERLGRSGASRCEATPAVHGRPGSAVGFLVRGTTSVYFAGDTDLFPELAGLADPLDVALRADLGLGPDPRRGPSRPGARGGGRAHAEAEDRHPDPLGLAAPARHVGRGVPPRAAGDVPAARARPGSGGRRFGC